MSPFINVANGHKASLRSRLVREVLRLLLRIPQLKGDNLLRVLKKHVNNEPAWKIPKGYGNTRLALGRCEAELLCKDNAARGKAVLLLHGGGYIVKLANFYRDMAVRYSVMANDAEVFSPDYRLAPEHVFPAALEDAMDAWNWLLARGYQAHDIMVAGDSAGGNLALALTLKLRDEGRELPGALVCMSPWTDMTASGRSHTEKYTRDPIFGNNPDYLPPKDGVMPAIRPLIMSYMGDTDPRNPYLSPAFASYEGFPPLLIQVGTEEILESDSEAVHQSAVQAGVEAAITHYHGLFHVFQICGNALPESRSAWNEVGHFIAEKFIK